MRTALSFLLLQLLFCSFAGAAFQVPPLRGPVQDETGTLSGSQIQQIEQFIRANNNSGLIQLQVLMVASLDGEPIESASIKVADAWKLGTEKKDNGVLLLIALGDKKMRIEVGQGLEGDLPDVIASRIIRNVIGPYFKQGQFAGGIQAGLEAIVQTINPVDGQKHSYEDGESAGRSGIPDGVKIFLIIVFVIVMLSIRGGGGGGFIPGGYGRHGGGFGGGGWSGGGGGGWSGGGGGFSGGGASGGW